MLERVLNLRLPKSILIFLPGVVARESSDEDNHFRLDLVGDIDLFLGFGPATGTVGFQPPGPYILGFELPVYPRNGLRVAVLLLLDRDLSALEVVILPEVRLISLNGRSRSDLSDLTLLVPTCRGFCLGARVTRVVFFLLGDTGLGFCSAPFFRLTLPRAAAGTLSGLPALREVLRGRVVRVDFPDDFATLRARPP